MVRPVLCRPEAYRAFTGQFARLETTDGLLRAATAVAMHEVGNLDYEPLNTLFSSLAERARAPIRHWTIDGALAHLHRVLFEEEQFTGNEESYYLAGNSYLPHVVQSRRGIPITLTLVYKAVAEKLGLQVVGVNLPGHFLAQVSTPDGPLLIDTFFGGMMLTLSEAWERAEQAIGQRIRRAPLGAATHAQWLMRMLHNLQHVFTAEGRRDDVMAMNELQSALQEGK